MSRILESHGNLNYFQTNPSQALAISSATGIDISAYFRHALSPICQEKLQDSISFQCSSPSFPSIIHCHDWSRVQDLLSSIVVGPVYYGWNDIMSNQNFVVFDGKVLNITAYLSNSSPIFGSDIDAVIRQNLNADITKAMASTAEGTAIGQCLVDMFHIGKLEAISTGCWTSQLILYVSFFIVMGLVLARFTFAIYFRWFISNQLGKIMKDSKSRKLEPVRRSDLDKGQFPITMNDQDGNLVVKHNDSTPFRSSLPRRSLTRKSKSSYGSEIHTIMLVTCYSEDTASLKLTFDSLAATEYNEDFKLLLIISDGIVKGHGNEKSTPDLIMDLLEFDTNWEEPQPLSYLAVADGAKQHNMAKVYVAWYNCQGQSVPTILIVKCGLAAETQKPGNRGKRDSQMILMRFLERITFSQRLCPLEYDLFLKMNYLMGTSPDCFQIVLMVDADTKVEPDSLARMVASMVRDPAVMGLCGETRIANKNDSWVTRIQVFEYYLSHHLTKAFESMFGGVTCLPGIYSLLIL
jgi:chitin synthase